MDIEEFFGEPIYIYTEDDAIADGALIHPYPDRWPWLLITPAIHAACSQGDGGCTYDQCLTPLLMDCIMQAQRAQRLKRDRAQLEHTIAGEVLILPNGKGGMTVMQAHEL